MKKWMSFLLMLLLLAAALLTHRSVARTALRTLPDSALASASRELSLRAFSERTKVDNVTPLLREAGTLEGRGVTAYYLTQEAPALLGIPMLYGSFVPWQDGDIVIDRALAAELFMTENAVGQTVLYNGRAYTVRGVSAPSEDLLSRISRIPTPEVYLPLGAYPDQEAGIGEYIVGLKMGLNGGVHYARIAPELELRLGVGLTFRSAYDFREARRLVEQSESLVRLLLALALCVTAAWWAARLGTGLIKAVRADADEGPTRALLRRRRETILFAVSLLCLAAGIFWVRRVGFPLFLPQDYISGSRGLLDYITESFQLANQKADLFLCTFSLRVKIVLALLDVLAAALLAGLVCRAIAAVKQPGDEE